MVHKKTITNKVGSVPTKRISKRDFYSELIRRAELNMKESKHLEASWYICAAIEDRLTSLLQSTGGAKNNKGSEIRMLGPKLNELNSRKIANPALKPLLDSKRIKDWKDSRNLLTR